MRTASAKTICIYFYLAVASLLVFQSCSSTGEKDVEKEIVSEEAPVPGEKVPPVISEETEVLPAEIEEEPGDTLYRLHPGDVLEISILDEPDMTREVTVIPDGTISYLLIGELEAEGKSISELRTDIHSRLEAYFKKPHVSVIAVKVQGRYGDAYASVYGAVKNAGKFKISRDDRLLDLIAMSGGPLIADQLISGDLGGRTLANLDASYMSRNGKKIPIDFTKLIRYGDMRYNLKLEPGDFVYIAELESSAIFVLGEVLEPRYLPITRDLTVIEAISRSGGFTDYARMGNVMVLRREAEKTKTIHVNTWALLNGDKDEENVLLKSGDIVFVPEQVLSEYARYAEYLSTFADLIVKGYKAREAVRFPRLNRHDQGL